MNTTNSPDPAIELFPKNVQEGEKIFRVDYSTEHGLYLKPTPTMTRRPLLRCGEFLLTIGGPLQKRNSAKALSEEQLRTLTPLSLRKAAFTAIHIIKAWATYECCPRCTGRLVIDGNGTMHCLNCNLDIFIPIAPAVIIAIVQDGKLLVTRYNKSPYNYKGPALVAGYCAPGETLEETCQREAREETNLELKGPFHYFGSQPWGISSSLLAGFFVSATRRRKLKLVDNELAEASWLTPEECKALLPKEGPFSLTMQMIQAFADGKHPFA